MSATRPSWTKILAVLTLLALTPLTASPGVGVEENRACAGPDNGGECVRELGSVCDSGGSVLWDHYYEP